MKTMLLGCDPEIFLVDAAGALVSAIDKIGGTKEMPRPIRGLGKGFAVQEDNVALEYNIPASGSPEEFTANINKVMASLHKEVNGLGLAFSKLSAASFPEKELADPRALEFGCDPDFNAWTGLINPKPKATDASLRSCGGHVHIGAEMKDSAAVIRRCDLFLGVPSTIQDNGLLRKKLYGKRGAFRPKPYGCEYRTLSNYWVFDDTLINWVWQNTRLALDAEHYPVEEDDKTIQLAIDDGDTEAAMFLIKKWQIPVVTQQAVRV